jgi:S-adenosylmethionine:tRNA ribosyltransferase-isomerase
VTTAVSFTLPGHLEASEPPEGRGLTRDAVRMLVGYRDGARVVHSTFSMLPTYLEPGDLVVVNTSGTLAAAVSGTDASGAPVVLHFSAELCADLWVVEPRRVSGRGSSPWGDAEGAPPRTILLEDGDARIELLEPYRESMRLWVARVRAPAPLTRWLAVHGRPIRYGYVERPWPLSYYQNVYVTEPGSAEMPSAGRPFTPELVTRLVAKGVGVTPVVLHTGVSSLESHERPYPERVRVPTVTAARANLARRTGGRVVAVGTTVVRALETAFDARSHTVQPFDGWTDVVVTAARGVHAVDGMLTGWHEPEASHLWMLEAVAGPELLEASYDAALAEGYLWHEFGDVHLVLP